MTILKKTLPAYSVPGTVVAPEGTGAVLARQVIVEARGDEDLESALQYSHYLFYKRWNLQPQDIPNRTPVPAEGLNFELLPLTLIKEPIVADEDFVTEWFGGLTLCFDTAGVCNVELRVKHVIGDRTFTVRAQHPFAVIAFRDQIVPLSSFNSLTSVPLQTPIMVDGQEHTFTEDDIKDTVSIEYSMNVQLWNNSGEPKDGNLEFARFERTQLRNYQIKTLVGGPIPGGGAVMPTPTLEDAIFFRVPMRVFGARPDATSLLDNRTDMETLQGVSQTWTVSGIPDDGERWLVGWLVLASDPQPRTWVTGGFNLENSVDAPFEVVMGGDTYNCYLYKDSAAADDTYNGSQIRVTT